MIYKKEGKITIKRKCYFYNCGVIFDKNNLEQLYDCWNYNGNCYKSDLCNGLWCEDYGIFFNKDVTINHIKYYVENGKENTYGYLKEIGIDLPEELWNDIFNNLINDYGYENKKDAKRSGFISFDFYEIIDDYSSYWEQPDISYLKKENKILNNVLVIKKENELNKDTIKWINEKIYDKKEDRKNNDLC